jgi:hypothetical protein
MRRYNELHEEQERFQIYIPLEQPNKNTKTGYESLPRFEMCVFEIQIPG